MTIFIIEEQGGGCLAAELAPRVSCALLTASNIKSCPTMSMRVFILFTYMYPFVCQIGVNSLDFMTNAIVSYSYSQTFPALRQGKRLHQQYDIDAVPIGRNP